MVIEQPKWVSHNTIYVYSTYLVPPWKQIQLRENNGIYWRLEGFSATYTGILEAHSWPIRLRSFAPTTIQNSLIGRSEVYHPDDHVVGVVRTPS